MNSGASLLLAAERSIIDIDATFLIQAAVFGAAFVIMRSLVFRPLMRVIDERHAQTEGAREDARRMQREADGTAKRIERELHEVRVETAADRERMRIIAKRREQEMIRQAIDDAARIAAEARARVDAARAAAYSEIPATARELSRTVVEKIAGRAA